jgi:hypothetical protein
MAGVAGLKDKKRLLRISMLIEWGQTERPNCRNRLAEGGVTAGHSRPKDGVASLACDPAVHDPASTAEVLRKNNVDCAT